jgi:hypothetical protein
MMRWAQKLLGMLACAASEPRQDCASNARKNHVEKVSVGGCVTEVSVESDLKHANHFRIHCEVGGNSINVSFHPL